MSVGGLEPVAYRPDRRPEIAEANIGETGMKGSVFAERFVLPASLNNWAH